MAKVHFHGTDFFWEDPPEDLRDCGSQPFVEDFMSRHEVTGDPDACRAFLRGYGAWDEDELLDHQTNLQRLVWLSAGALGDGEEIYFSGY